MRDAPKECLAATHSQNALLGAQDGLRAVGAGRQPQGKERALLAQVSLDPEVLHRRQRHLRVSAWVPRRRTLF